MNYSYPYLYNYPQAATSAAGKGIISSLLGGRSFNWGSILSNTQRTLGIVNQALPLVRQAGPVIKNAKTMFRVMNEFKKIDGPTKANPKTVTNNDRNQTMPTQTNQQQTTSSPVGLESGPTFFV